MKLTNRIRMAGAFAVLALGCAATAAHAQTVALTFDDGPVLASTPKLTAQQRNAALLAHLKKYQVRAALMVTCGNGADRPEGYALARAWGEAGHVIGNHTMSHLDLNNAAVSLLQYQQEILACDQITGSLPGYQKWFRFTYLREGNTPEKRDGMRSFLQQQGYRNAYVSLDTSDWRLDQYLRDTLSANPAADLSAIHDAYLSHIRQRALAYRDLSRQLQGRDIAQVMLLHHNLINALWLGDVIAQFHQMGWTIVTPEQAFQDSVYRLQPAIPVPGQSLLLSMARSLGLERFEGWQRLVDDGDFEINSLTAGSGTAGR